MDAVVAYVSELWNAWIWWAGGMFMAFELVRFLLKRDWGWPATHPWRIALAFLVLAQFGAYQSLKTSEDASADGLRATIGAVTKERDGLAQERARFEGANVEKDKRIQELTAVTDELRDKLADARANRPIDVRVSGGAPTMPAVTEGWRVSTRQVPSRDESSPYALEVTIQVSAAITPFGAVIRTSRPLRDGEGGISGGGLYTMHMKSLSADGRVFEFGFDSPTVTQQRPAVATLWAKEPFTIERVSPLRQ